MDDRDHNSVTDRTLNTWRHHRFLVMVAGAIMIAFMLVLISMGLYYAGGAAQIDLSPPTYDEVRADLENDTTQVFPATGSLDQAAIDDFQAQLSKQIEQTSGSQGFGSGALSDSSLGLGITDEPVTP